MKRNGQFLIFFIAFCFWFPCYVFSGEIIIFHAGSLTKPLEEIGEAFKKKHPDIEVIRESSGSREGAFKVAHLNRECDLVFSSDFKVIEEILIPRYTNWYFIFARNEMVIAFSEWSKYSSEINKDNWPQILSRDEVKVGRSDANLDPCGYRTLMVWQLAGGYYNQRDLYQRLDKNCPPPNVRPKEIELVAQIESLDLDYIFQYLSVAVQHRLQYIKLPKEINLGYSDYEDNYKQARVNVKNSGGESEVEGSTIHYALTLLNNAPHRVEAIKFLKFLTSEEAKNILENNGHPVYFRLQGEVPADVKFLEEQPIL